MASGVVWLAGRSGSGDGELKASMTRQMPSGPLPVSVLFDRFFWRNGNEKGVELRWVLTGFRTFRNSLTTGSSLRLKERIERHCTPKHGSQHHRHVPRSGENTVRGGRLPPRAQWRTQSGLCKVTCGSSCALGTWFQPSARTRSRWRSCRPRSISRSCCWMAEVRAVHRWRPPARCSRWRAYQRSAGGSTAATGQGDRRGAWNRFIPSK